MKQIIIKFIQDDQHRNGQGPADWWFDENGDFQIRVTDMGDWRYNYLCARHEMDEIAGCKHAGITTQQVDDYCAIPESELPSEPDSFSGYPKSPHQKQHNDALAAEWQFSRVLDVDWVEYGKSFERFWKLKH